MRVKTMQISVRRIDRPGGPEEVIWDKVMDNPYIKPESL